MSRGIYVKRNKKWVKVTTPQFQRDGEWTLVQKGFVRQNGQWKQIFPTEGTEIFTTPGIQGWTVPEGVYSINATVIGAGGGGGGSGTQYGPGGGGGGGGAGGAVTATLFKVRPGENLQITIGTGGLGAPPVGATSIAPGGEDGTPTTIKAEQAAMTAIGGKGGGGATFGTILSDAESVTVGTVIGGKGGQGGNVSISGTVQLSSDAVIFSGTSGADGLTSDTNSVAGVGAVRIQGGSGGNGANSSISADSIRSPGSKGQNGAVLIKW